MTDRVLAEKVMGWHVEEKEVNFIPGGKQTVPCWVDESGATGGMTVASWNPSQNETQLTEVARRMKEQGKLAPAIAAWMKTLPARSELGYVCEWITAPTKEKADALAEVVRGGE